MKGETSKMSKEKNVMMRRILRFWLLFVTIIGTKLASSECIQSSSSSSSQQQVFFLKNKNKKQRIPLQIHATILLHSIRGGGRSTSPIKRLAEWEEEEVGKDGEDDEEKLQRSKLAKTIDHHRDSQQMTPFPFHWLYSFFRREPAKEKQLRSNPPRSSSKKEDLPSTANSSTTTSALENSKYNAEEDKTTSFPTRNSDGTSSSSSSSSSVFSGKTSPPYDPIRMYTSCMVIVFIWISSGTIFYSMCNSWPIPQSFFYAVDAGMSIGFCIPDVAEHKLVSKAFTIIYILLGASVVGGALALFIQDIVEGLAYDQSSGGAPATQQYQLLLEKEAFDTANISRTGALSYNEFRQLLLATMNSSSSSGSSTAAASTPTSTADDDHESSNLSEEQIQLLWKKFDKLNDGVIHFEEFTGTFRGVERLIKSIRRQQKSSILNPIQRVWLRMRYTLQEAWQREHRIYVVFMSWISLGILWGIFDQRWDPITATHFAVSALATGGLTAPQVNSDGILPADPAIFCGVFCLFGIPLFYLTLGHYAHYLVSGHVAALEESALTRPITRVEFDFAKRLTTPEDPFLHLSDFIVLQLLRQGKISMGAIIVMKRNFDLLDVNNTGKLSYEEIRAASCN